MFRILILSGIGIAVLLMINQASLYNMADRLYPLVSNTLALENHMFKSDKYQKLLKKYSDNYSRLEHADYLFLGDSHIQYLNTATYFPNKNVINYGIAGDTTLGVLKRLPHSQAQPKIKKKVLFMVGYNDLKYRDVEEIISNHRTLVITAAKQLEIPFSKIALQSLFPVSEKRSYVNDSIIRINHAEKALCAELGCTFLDLYSNFADPKGGLREQYSKDGVHLNQTGYDLWTSLLKKALIFD